MFELSRLLYSNSRAYYQLPSSLGPAGIRLNEISRWFERVIKLLQSIYVNIIFTRTCLPTFNGTKGRGATGATEPD